VQHRGIPDLRAASMFALASLGLGGYSAASQNSRDFPAFFAALAEQPLSPAML